MRKKKTVKAVTKRVKITKDGKIKRRKSGHSHLLSGKSSKTRRSYRRSLLFEPVYAAKIKLAV